MLQHSFQSFRKLTPNSWPGKAPATPLLRLQSGGYIISPCSHGTLGNTGGGEGHGSTVCTDRWKSCWGGEAVLGGHPRPGGWGTEGRPAVLVTTARVSREGTRTAKEDMLALSRAFPLAPGGQPHICQRCALGLAPSPQLSPKPLSPMCQRNLPSAFAGTVALSSMRAAGA